VGVSTVCAHALMAQARVCSAASRARCAEQSETGATQPGAARGGAARRNAAWRRATRRRRGQAGPSHVGGDGVRDAEADGLVVRQQVPAQPVREALGNVQRRALPGTNRIRGEGEWSVGGREVVAVCARCLKEKHARTRARTHRRHTKVVQYKNHCCTRANATRRANGRCQPKLVPLEAHSGMEIRISAPPRAVPLRTRPAVSKTMAPGEQGCNLYVRTCTSPSAPPAS
jgi:hypothetical protein